MLANLFSSEKDYFRNSIDGKAVIIDDCPDDLFESRRKEDDGWFKLENEHCYANFDPYLSKKYNLRTK